MSVRSSRRLKDLRNFDLTPFKCPDEQITELSNKKQTRSVRKVRKTNDLIWFDASGQDLAEKASRSHSELKKNVQRDQLSKKRDRKVRKTNDLVCLDTSPDLTEKSSRSRSGLKKNVQRADSDSENFPKIHVASPVDANSASFVFFERKSDKIKPEKLSRSREIKNNGHQADVLKSVPKIQVSPPTSASFLFFEEDSGKNLPKIAASSPVDSNAAPFVLFEEKADEIKLSKRSRSHNEVKHCVQRADAVIPKIHVTSPYSASFVFFEESVEVKQKPSRSQDSVVFEEKTDRKRIRVGTFTRLNSPMNEKRKSFESQALNSTFVTEKIEKRKIVRAKRFLKNEKLEEKPDSKIHTFLLDEKSFSKCEELMGAPEINNTFLLDEKSLTKCEDSMGAHESQQNEINHTFLMDEKTLSRCEDSMGASNYSLIVETLPSPISPSASIEEDSILQRKYLHFNSSKEDLHPSTSGSIKAAPRRTSELEDSFILKSVSEQINSFPEECETPEKRNDSKVTVRKRWDKSGNKSAIWLHSCTPTPKKPSPKKVTPKRKFPSSSKAKSRELIQKVVTNRSGSTAKKFVSRIKVPNFAAIHEKALNKMENISEYKKRKEDRARMLLSGRKPDAPTPTKKETRKQLRFAVGTHDTEKSPTFIPLPSTPLPKKVVTPFKFEKAKFALGDFPNENKKNVTPFKFEKAKFAFGDFPKENKKNVTPFKFEKAKFAEKASHLPMPKKILNVKNENLKGKEKPFTFQNFCFNHQGAKNANKFQNVCFKQNTNLFQKPEIKSIVTKSKPQVNVMESRRCAIKGVRSNRRFELLMNMRKGK